MLFFVAYSCFTSIYYASFEDKKGTVQFNFDIVVEFFFLTDILLNFLQEYRDPDTYTMVRSLKKIAFKYVLTITFCIDVISIFPFE